MHDFNILGDGSGRTEDAAAAAARSRRRRRRRRRLLREDGGYGGGSDGGQIDEEARGAGRQRTGAGGRAVRRAASAARELLCIPLDLNETRVQPGADLNVKSLVVTLKAQKAQQIGPCEPCGPITIPNDARIPPPPASPSCRQDPHLHRQRRGGRRGEDEEEALPPVRRGIGAPPDEPRTREQRSSRLLFEGSSGWSEAEEEASGRLQLFVIIGIKTMGSIRHPI
ncbi:hypothetical protein BHM03_00049903 [Ensete ventricosum]|nr:hypothetical protein BHM03_00049903 [Ensete ventricosum]